jgi:hypothetical protein
LIPRFLIEFTGDEILGWQIFRSGCSGLLLLSMWEEEMDDEMVKVLDGRWWT